jgi:hypothetical protein
MFRVATPAELQSWPMGFNKTVTVDIFLRLDYVWSTLNARSVRAEQLLIHQNSIVAKKFM